MAIGKKMHYYRHKFKIKPCIVIVDELLIKEETFKERLQIPATISRLDETKKTLKTFDIFGNLPEKRVVRVVKKRKNEDASFKNALKTVIGANAAIGEAVNSSKKKKKVSFNDDVKVIHVSRYIRQLKYISNLANPDEKANAVQPVAKPPVVVTEKKATKWLNYIREKHFESRSACEYIIQHILADMFRLWCCPLCDLFDCEDGVPDKIEVNHHILNNHLGLYLLDLVATSDRNFSHENLMAKVTEMKLEPADYMPLQVDKSHSGRNQIKYKCLRCSVGGVSFKTKAEIMLHLAVNHYMDCLIPHYSKASSSTISYECSQSGCEQKFNTRSALVVHEQLQHNALELYLGKMCGINDLYEEFFH